MKTHIILFLICMGLTQYQCQKSAYSTSDSPKNWDKEIRNLSSFDQVEASTGISVEMEQSPTFNVEVWADNSENLSKLETYVQGSTLKIRVNGRVKNGNFKVVIQMPKLDRLVLDVGSSVNLMNEFQTQNFSLLVDTGSSFTGSIIATQNMEIQSNTGSSVNAHIISQQLILEVNTGSSAHIKGKTETLKVRADNGSSAHLKDLENTSYQATAMSGSSIEVSPHSKGEKYVDDSSSINP